MRRLANDTVAKGNLAWIPVELVQRTVPKQCDRERRIARSMLT